MILNYKVEGMHCGACAANLEHAIQTLQGVKQVEVNLLKESMRLEVEKDFQEQELMEQVKRLGFSLIKIMNTMTQTYHVEGMMCAACSASVEKILSKQASIQEVSVQLLTKKVTITYSMNEFTKWQEALHNAGFALREEEHIEHVVLDVEGMKCAACSAGLEKSIKSMDGIKHVEINLLMNCAYVDYDQKKIKLSQILQRIEQSGFHAKKRIEQVREEQDRSSVKVYSTLVLGLVLLYIGMSHMLGSIELPLPTIIHYNHHPLNFAMIQFVLATIILLLGKDFFIRGSKALLHKVPNMDTLVAMGTMSAYVYSLFSLYRILQGDVHAVHALYFESAGVVVALVQFGKHLEEISKKKSTSAISALLKLRPSEALLVKDEEEIVIDVEEAMVHDRFVVKPGEHIPVDGIVIEGIANVDESMLTGESIPVKKQVQDEVIQGSINLDGRIVMECRRAQDETTLANIIRLVETAQAKKAPIARIADQISLYFVPTVMLIAFVALLLWFIATKDFTLSLTVFVSVLVIACPCALGLATPTAIMVGSGRAAQLGIFMKSGEALETTSRIDTIVFDKTGTITKGKPAVIEIYSTIDQELALQYANALEQGSKHPFAYAIVEQAKQKNITSLSLNTIQTHNGKGLSSVLEGKVLRIGSESFMKQEHIATNVFEQEVKQCYEQGQSVIYLSIDQQVVAIFAIADQVKEESKEVVKSLRKQGIEVYMLTGDHEKVAKSIGEKVGISHVIAQVLPDQKSEKIKELQMLGKKVAMVGDGINDAIALTQADVGIAIGSGSDVAMDCADIVLMKDDLRDVEKAISLSKAVLRNIRQNLFWAFFYNSLGIPVAAGILVLFGGPLLSPVFAGAAMALSSVSVVSNALRLKKFK